MFKTFLLHSVYSGFPQKMWTILRCENENVKKKSIERSWKIVCIIIYYMWGHLTIQVVLTHSFSMYVSAYICWGHRNNAALEAYLWKGKGFHKAVKKWGKNGFPCFISAFSNAKYLSLLCFLITFYVSFIENKNYLMSVEGPGVNSSSHMLYWIILGLLLDVEWFLLFAAL